PGGDLDLLFNLRAAYDSTQVWVDGALLETLPANTPLQQHTITVPVLASGTVSAFARSFKAGTSYDSTTKTADVFPMAAPVTNYLNTLDNSGDLLLNNSGFTWSTPAGFASAALHSTHDYADNAVYTSALMVPITVTNNSELIFDEIAIMEPGEPGSVFGDSDFWDYVVVEGSSDGVVWQALAPGWDARDDADWLTAYNFNFNGDDSLYRTRTISMNDTFTSGDTVLLRWRLISDGSATGWGWAVDNIEVTGTTVTAVGDTPRVVSLAQNYPNPFNPSTTISFNLPRSGQVKLQVYDARGHLVRTLLDGQAVAGQHTEVWDGRDNTGRQSASGVYLYRLIAGELVQQKKMTLVK
ncbi:MAG: FlgD immunoglobulin-like domain containing protein, partial [Candidatus Krumholzibacteria bacterium]|nr:FlgD immunoglobulin-like domain containing protein [Candidatus Krumholzibacteria bacterium]